MLRTSLSLSALTEVQAGTQVTFWECAKLSCTCEPNDLCDHLTVALCGCLSPIMLKVLEVGNFLDVGGYFIWNAPIES